MPIDDALSKRPDFDPLACAMALEGHAFSAEERDGWGLPREKERDAVALLQAAQDWFDDERADRSIRYLSARAAILAAGEDLSSISTFELTLALRHTAGGLRQLHKLNELRASRRKYR